VLPKVVFIGQLVRDLLSVGSVGAKGG